MSNYRLHSTPLATTRSSGSVGPSPLATRSCRSRTTTTRRSITVTLATSIASIPPMASSSSTSTADPSPRGLEVPAYAATIHKSQGSEYPAVVIPIMTQHYAMLRRNLLYTGVTRGKKLVVLVGQKKAVAIGFGVANRQRTKGGHKPEYGEPQRELRRRQRSNQREVAEGGGGCHSPDENGKLVASDQAIDRAPGQRPDDLTDHGGLPRRSRP